MVICHTSSQYQFLNSINLKISISSSYSLCMCVLATVLSHNDQVVKGFHSAEEIKLPIKYVHMFSA